MYSLIKMSSPGWRKGFGSRDELKVALAEHICSDCWDVCGMSIEDMLNSICGLEFYYTGPDENDEPLTAVELLSLKMNGY